MEGRGLWILSLGLRVEDSGLLAEGLGLRLKT